MSGGRNPCALVCHKERLLYLVNSCQSWGLSTWKNIDLFENGSKILVTIGCPEGYGNTCFQSIRLDAESFKMFQISIYDDDRESSSGLSG